MKNKHIFQKIFFLILSVILFAAANPNYFFPKGLGFLAFIYFTPVFILVNYCTLKNVWIYGGLYGAISYGLYAYWLHTFNPICLIAACIVYFIFLAIVFIFLKLADILFKKNAWLMQWLCICGFEYIKTKGFLGFNYGVTAYTQWNNIYLLQIAKFTGPWGVSAFVLFCSAFIASFIIKRKESHKYDFEQHLTSVENLEDTNVFYRLESEKIQKSFSTKSTAICFLCWLVVYGAIFVYSKIIIQKEDNNEQIKVVALQSNESPWKNGVEAQSKDIQKLMELTDEALELHPDIEIVVWPETSVVPAIVYQYETNKDERKNQLVKRVLEYINSKDATFVIGNGHEVNSQKSIHDVYNSALVFTPRKNVIPPEPKIYSKMKLVPFSETFPFTKQFPELSYWLSKHFLHNWTAGKEIKIFNKEKLFFSTPICFEDTFPEISRKMFQKGARCFINLSNDSWSESVPCQYQHLAMAVFRSVENGVPTVRSTTSGQTCIINKNGKITSMCMPFSYSYAFGSVSIAPQYQNPTIYNIIGDVFGIIPFVVFLILLLIKALFVIIKKSNK